MIRTIYIFILTYFVLGGIGFYLINRKKDPAVARKSYVKFITYFFIIHILFFSIVLYPAAFRWLSLLIILAGFFEMLKLFRSSGYLQKPFFVASVVIYSILSAGFFWFSGLQKELILFSFLILSIFDSFSQITGQLFGKRKIAPDISPNKTLGGMIGGFLFAMGSALLLRDLYAVNTTRLIMMAAGVVIFAFGGDLAASVYKRKFKVKDYSNLIPGHGGLLDRFDSLIAGGAWVTIGGYVLNF
jgi:phosphatidate cytidylyltransferase